MVAMAHGREFLIWRRLSRDMKSSIEVSMSLCLSDLRKVESEGVCPTIDEGMFKYLRVRALPKLCWKALANAHEEAQLSLLVIDILLWACCRVGGSFTVYLND